MLDGAEGVVVAAIKGVHVCVTANAINSHMCGTTWSLAGPLDQACEGQEQGHCESHVEAHSNVGDKVGKGGSPSLATEALTEALAVVAIAVGQRCGSHAGNRRREVLMSAVTAAVAPLSPPGCAALAIRAIDPIVVMAVSIYVNAIAAAVCVAVVLTAATVAAAAFAFGRAAIVTK